MNKLDAVIHRRTEARRATASRSVSNLIEAAKTRGVEISVVGSLASDRFRVHSDIDLLVHGEIGPARRAMVERLVADHLRDTALPYDLIFACDMTPERVRELLHGNI